MTAITYTAAFDPFHAIFRMLCLFEYDSKLSLQTDQVRIMDFYVCFPQFLDSFEAAREMTGFVKLKNSVMRRFDDKDPYSRLPSPRQLFRRMEPTQMAAINTLSSSGIVEVSGLPVPLVSRADFTIPEKLRSEVHRFLKLNADLMAAVNLMAGLRVTGPSGLKRRSRLEEYRYDAV
ncbi:ABC-three component system middle component 5 [Aestuariivirga sp.]|uniref:ABC-three component system middle component 5 n=1 Tax=Aestuariivirga sp. TaxID=2650926 RepID=UPI0039E35388